MINGSWRQIQLWFAAGLMLSGAIFVVPHGDFTGGATWPFHLAVVLMAIGWLVALTVRRVSGPTFWAVAVALRVILLPMQPGMDMHRYIWEGRIQRYGFDPYCASPNADALQALRDRNWAQVEFKDTTAIYPPLAEFGFRLFASVSESALFFKLTFVAADLVVCFLLSRRFGFAPSVLYAWNPLVLYSFAGGGHFDSWFVLALCGGWLLWEKKAFTAAALLLAAATATKWIALPILIWSVIRIGAAGGKGRAMLTACAASLTFLIPWLVVTNGDVRVPLFPKEFVLYARSFGVAPTILSAVCPDAFWQNKVYLVAIGVAALLVMQLRSVTLLSERWLALLLVLSPMMHPWYFTWLMPFAVATRNIGVIAVSVSAFAYFGISNLPAMPQTGWTLLFVQTGIIWLPFIGGFAWSEYRSHLNSELADHAAKTITVKGKLASRDGINMIENAVVQK